MSKIEKFFLTGLFVVLGSFVGTIVGYNLYLFFMATGERFDGTFIGAFFYGAPLGALIVGIATGILIYRKLP